MDISIVPMSDTQLKRLEAEKKKLQDEAEFTQGIMKVSEAANELVKQVKAASDPFVDSSISNPYTKKAGGSGCDLL